MLKVKQKDILNLLRPYAMSVITADGKKTIELDYFMSVCIDKYKKGAGAVNISYYKKQQ